MSIEAELNELERRQLDAFAAWDQIRLFSSAVPMSHRPGFGFLARIPILRQVLLGIQRSRYARVLADRQRELNLISLERASRLTQLIDIRVASVDARLDQRLDQRIADVDQRAGAARDLATVVHRDVGKAMNEIHDRIDTTTSYVTFQSGELRREFFEFHEDTRFRLIQAESRLEDHGERIQELEEKTRLQGSHIRRLDQSNTTSQTASGHLHPLAGERLPRLISLLEQRIPELVRARQVGVTIQDGVADEMIAIQSAYFGERLGMYGTKDDAWYHVDFTPEWNRDILFENALSKLQPGGHFILISAAGNIERGDNRPLEQVLSEVFDVTPTVRASVHIWRRPSGDIAHG